MVYASVVGRLPAWRPHGARAPMVYGSKTVLAAVVVAMALTGGCGPALEEVCGLPSAPPSADEAPEGRVTATLDGAPFREPGSWSAGPNGDLTAGTLSIIIANDESGTRVADLVGRGAFPICVPIGDRSPESGNATYDSRFVTDAQHGGSVAILAEEGGYLVGRFAVTLKDGSGASGDTAEFEGGAFRIERR